MSELEPQDALFPDDRPSKEVELADRPITAQDVLGVVVDLLSRDGILMTSRVKGIIAKQTKELLLDGLDPDVILRAAVASCYRSQPAIMHLLAFEITVAEAGKHMSPREWREKVNSYKAANSTPSAAEQLVQSAYKRKRDGNV